MHAGLFITLQQEVGLIRAGARQRFTLPGKSGTYYSYGLEYNNI